MTSSSITSLTSSAASVRHISSSWQREEGRVRARCRSDSDGSMAGVRKAAGHLLLEGGGAGGCGRGGVVR
eukprot:756752-Hanusia_phi.AAC.1